MFGLLSEWIKQTFKMKVTKQQLIRIIKEEIQRVNEIQAPGDWAVRIQTERLVDAGFNFDIIEYVRPGKYVVRGVPVDQLVEMKETIQSIFDSYIFEEITGSRPNLRDIYYGV